MRARSSTPAQELTAQLEELSVRALGGEYDQLNDDLFHGMLRRPALRFTDGANRLGLWETEPPTISIARKLLLDGAWGRIVEVLKHEMAHQYVSQVLRVQDAPHGPVFRKVCEERGIDGRAAGEAASAKRPSHDVLAKVSRLLALAESGNPHEAEAAMSAAQRLMLKYNLEQVQTLEDKGYRVQQIGQPTGRVEESARVLASILGEFFFVEILWVSVWRPFAGKWGSVLEVCGAHANVEMAQYVHDFLTHTAERLWHEHKKERGIRKNRDRRRYIAGVMAGFYGKLHQARRANQAQGLLWVGDPKLQAFFRKRHPRIRSVSYGTSYESAAYSEGRKAGASIVLHKGISSGPSRGGPKLLA